MSKLSVSDLMARDRRAAFRSVLRSEQLEDRVVPTLYVITHGFQASSTDAPAWARDMATAINNRLGLGVTDAQIDASVVAYNAAALDPPAGGSANFLIFNWANVSGFTSPGTADDDAVAGRLADLVRRRLPATGTEDIHFIGHSRGTYVNLSAINRLNDDGTSNAKIGRLQMTTLDPEFYNNNLTGNNEDIALVVPANVDWAENYFQTADSLGGGEYGSPTGTGFVNIDLTATLTAWNGRGGAQANHAEVHDWYHWTIDTNDSDVTTVDYEDNDLDTQEGIHVSNPDQGRRLLFNQTPDLDNDGRPDDAANGSNIGFRYSISDSFGPRAFAGFTSLDLMFVIDTTGSMGDDIAAVKTAARDIVNQIRSSVPDARIGLVLYKDFGDEYQVTTPVPLTADIDALLAQIAAIEVGGGGDWPESVYSGLAAAIASPWRGGTVRKAVILMGDAPAHEPEEGTGLTKAQILTRAFRADPVDTYAVVVNDDADAIRGFTTLASLSGGEFFNADGADEVVPAITKAITSIAKAITVPAGAKLVGPVLIGGPKDGSAILFTPDKGAYVDAGSKVYIPGSTNVRTATADVNGDGVFDYVTGAGPGGVSRIVVTNGATGATIADFNVFEGSFTGGVFLAAADLNGDGKAEVLVTPDQGGGPVVAIYDGARLSSGSTGDAAQIIRFFGIDDSAFRGGARPALGDVNGDGTQDLAISAGFQGGPRIALFNGQQLLTRAADINAAGGRPDQSFRFVGDFFAFEDSLRNGAYVAIGDTDGDGKGDLFFGGGPNGTPRVRVYGGAQLLAASAFSKLDEIAGAQLADFFAGPDTLRGGVAMSVRDVDADSRGDLLTASGLGEAAKVRVFKSATLRTSSPVPDQVIDLFGGATLAEGVYVG